MIDQQLRQAAASVKQSNPNWTLQKCLAYAQQVRNLERQLQAYHYGQGHNHGDF